METGGERVVEIDSNRERGREAERDSNTRRQ